MSLTPKQQRFVDEYLVDLCASAAYKRAGYAARGNSAEVNAARLLRHAQVQAAINAAQVDRSQRTKIDADWVLRRLTDEAEADVSDLYDEHGDLKPVHQWPPIWRKGLVAGIETVREKVGEDEDGKPLFATVRKIKLSDRGRRIELLGKHVYVSAFREKIDHTSSDGSMSPPSLADFYRADAAPKTGGDV